MYFIDFLDGLNVFFVRAGFTCNAQESSTKKKIIMRWTLKKSSLSVGIVMVFPTRKNVRNMLLVKFT